MVITNKIHCFIAEVYCISLLGLSPQNTTDRAPQTTDIYFSQSWRLGARDRGACRSGRWWALSQPQRAALCHVLARRREEASCGVSLPVRALTPPRGPTLMTSWKPNRLPKSCLHIPSHPGKGFHVNWGDTVQPTARI